MDDRAKEPAPPERHLQYEAMRVAREKLVPIVQAFVDEFDIDDDRAVWRLSQMVSAALQEGVRLGEIDAAAVLDKHGITYRPIFHFTNPFDDEPEGRTE